MKTVEPKVLLQTLGISIAVGFYIWANYLTKPIMGKSATELSSDMANRISSSIAAMFKDALDQPYEIHKTSYDIIWNLAVPLLLLIIVTAILGTVGFYLIKSIFIDTDTKLNIALKCMISIGLVYVTVMSLLKTVNLFVLNFAVAFIAFLFFALIVGLITAPFARTQEQK
jgi:hypothetical protein